MTFSIAEWNIAILAWVAAKVRLTGMLSGLKYKIHTAKEALSLESWESKKAVAKT